MDRNDARDMTRKTKDRDEDEDVFRPRLVREDEEEEEEEEDKKEVVLVWQCFM